MTRDAILYFVWIRSLFWMAFGAFWGGVYFLRDCGDMVTLAGLGLAVLFFAHWDLGNWRLYFGNKWRVPVPMIAFLLTATMSLGFSLAIRNDITFLVNLLPEHLVRCSIFSGDI